jgi:hypothetical protein
MILEKHGLTSKQSPVPAQKQQPVLKDFRRHIQKVKIILGHEKMTVAGPMRHNKRFV